MPHPWCGAVQGQSVFTQPLKTRQSFPRLSLEAVKTAHDTSREFGRLGAASVRICLHLYGKLVWRCVLISTSRATSSCSQEVGILRVLLTNFFLQQQQHILRYFFFHPHNSSSNINWLTAAYTVYDSWFENMRRQTQLSHFSLLLSCFILPFNTCSASSSSPFSSPSLDNRERGAEMAGEKGGWWIARCHVAPSNPAFSLSGANLS